MNKATQEIADYAQVTLTEALEIQNHIDSMALLDWSQCSDREFRWAVRFAIRDMIGELAGV